MDYDQSLDTLLRALLEEAGRPVVLPEAHTGRRKLLRALMNIRPPRPIDPGLLALQDAILREELSHKTVADAAGLPPSPLDSRLSLWQGDITLLRCDAIVNAANPALLGCFHPLHSCIDNAIHSAAGIQLRLACHALMQAQGHEEPPGRAKLTPGFQLPARYVIHTVGPAVQGDLTQAHRDALASCYRSCLELAEAHGLERVAFCCISTGVYGFPPGQAAPIAVDTVRQTLDRCPHVKQVVFNVFTNADLALYRALLG